MMAKNVFLGELALKVIIMLYNLQNVVQVSDNYNQGCANLEIVADMDN